jgi:excisionase family DNA binding protein
LHNLVGQDQGLKVEGIIGPFSLESGVSIMPFLFAKNACEDCECANGHIGYKGIFLFLMGGGSVMANIVKAKELGDYLKLSDSTIYKLALNGELPGFKIGDSWRFDMDEVIEHIKRKKGYLGVEFALMKNEKNREGR